MSCPICSKESVAAYKPFCSKRCADLDLAKWFSGSYAIPSASPEDAEAAADELERMLEEASKDSREKLH